MPRAQSLIRIRISAVAVVMLLLAACGSDKPATAEPQITSVDQSKALSSLTATEMQTLCTDLGSYLVAQTSGAYAARACVQSAVVAAAQSDDAVAAQACRSAYDTCMGPSNPKNTSGITILGLCPNAAPASPDCALTVAQYLQCLKDLSPIAIAAWSLQSNLCSNLASCTGSCNSPLTLPSSCLQVRDTCVGLRPNVVYTTTN